MSTLLFAQKHSLDLAVHSGGHFSGDANSSEGVVIDLRNFSGVEVDPENKKLKAKGGAKWPAVDKAAAEHGLAALGGGSQTGVGGFTLGGGYGLLTGAHGLVLDNLLAARVVLADGRIVDVSETVNQDLFWALRGAGPGFGIIVEFTFKLHEQRTDVWAGALGFPLPKAGEVFRFTDSAIPTGSGRAALMVILCAPPPAFKPVLVVAIFYNGPASSAKDFFKPLYELAPIFDATKEMPYAVANNLANQPPPIPGTRRIMNGAVFPTSLKSGIFQSVIDEYVSFINAAPAGVSAEIVWEFHDFSRILAVPETATAFPNRGNYRNVMIKAAWPNDNLDKQCRDWALGAEEKSRQIFESSGADSNGGTRYYANYDSKRSFPCPACEPPLTWLNRLHHAGFKGLRPSL